MKYLFVAVLIAGSLHLNAQLEVPVRIALTGASAGDRQVLGLADPTQADAAVSVDASRSAVMNTTTTTGTSTLIGALVPSPTSFVPGMLVTIVPQEANVAGASLDLNGSGAYPVVKWGNVPVDSADLAIGVPSRLIFDGARYQVLTALAKPCPQGASPGGALFCIGDSVVAEGSFYDAVNVCTSRGGRLCTFGEWSSACRRQPGFLATVNAYEWLDDAANNGNDAKTMGSGYNGPDIVEGPSCILGNTQLPTLIHKVRCCFDR